MTYNRQTITSTKHERIPALDGLRFFAAFSVMIAHYSHWVLGDQGVHNSLTNLLSCIAGLGMPLFFVLSGFVIHYNYHRLPTKPGGIKAFLIARFTRLYPLYITLFIIEFVISFHLRRGSAGYAGERLGFFLALPYYLSLTQDWIYGIIAHNNLIYQYHMVSAVSWSISLEAFFYLAYILLAYWLVKQKGVFKQVLVIAITQIGLFICLIYCNRYEDVIDKIALVGFGQYATMQNGFQDSLLRWLYYFNPMVNLPAFFFGTVIANIYLIKKDNPLHRLEKKCGALFTGLSVIATLGLHFWLYLYVAPTNGFIGRTASLLTVPLIGLMICCLTRYPSTLINKCISWKLFVKLGEASYSIYLLHAFFGWYSRDFYYLGLNPWILYILAMGCILIISRCSYVIFERPIQKWLRKKMTNQVQPSTTSNLTLYITE